MLLFWVFEIKSPTTSFNIRKVTLRGCRMGWRNLKIECRIRKEFLEICIDEEDSNYFIFLIDTNFIIDIVIKYY